MSAKLCVFFTMVLKGRGYAYGWSLTYSLSFYQIFINYISEFFSSKYEAYVTNTKSFKYNKNLPMICFVFQFLTSVSLLLTACIIKICFTFRKKKYKPKIKNTINFKTLNLAYGFGLLSTALLHLIVMQLDTYMFHYTVAIVVNMMLGSFLYSNADARDYVKTKVQSWQDMRKLIKETKLEKKSYSTGVGPWMQPAVRNKRSVRDVSYRNGSDSVFVIDINQG